MLTTTPGRLMIDRELPPDLRDPTRVLDKKGIAALFRGLAEKHPEKYREVAHRLLTLGGEIAYAHGGLSFGPEHLRPAAAAVAARRRMRAELDAILDDPKLDDAAREKAVVALADRWRPALEAAVFDEASAAENPLALQIRSGVRGNRSNLLSLLGGDLAYADHRGNPLPVLVERSYAEGLTPAEYWAGAYGARKGVTETKLCLHEDTPVRMADFSTRRICEITPGDTVLGADRLGRTFPVRVLRVFDNGERRCYRHHFRVGQTKRLVAIDATPDHEVLARLKLGRSGAAAHRAVYTPTPLPLSRCVKDFVAVPSGSFSPEIGVDEPRALLLGMLLGDGCIAGNNGTLSFSCAEDELIAVMRAELAKVGCRIRKSGTGYTWLISRDHAVAYPEAVALAVRRRRKTSLLPNLCRVWLEELGLHGTHSHTKFIPDVVWTWNQRSVADLLAGLLVTDGCFHVGKTTGVVKISLTSRAMVETMVALLETRFGIRVGTIQRRDAARMRVGKRDQWSFAINGREMLSRLASQVFIPGRKGRALDAWLAGLPPAKNAKPGEFPYQGREDLGMQPTFDLEVDHPDHLFVLANGLVVSNSVAKSGYVAKQLLNAAHRLVVTAKDADREPPDAADRGLPVAADDPDNEGALLARPAAGFPRNTVLTPRVLAAIRDAGVDKLLVRSPAVGGPADGGVYARDAGVRERGRLAPVGDYVGHAAAHSLGERTTQMSLSGKHSGGVAGAKVSPFEALNKLLNPPQVYPEAATHARTGGAVTRVEAAPQGGHYVHVGGEKHHVIAGHAVLVKPGDDVEPGDVLSEGVPNPAEIVAAKGIGEGRRYMVDALRDVFRSAGLAAHRRNVELVARGLVNHVRVEEPFGDFLPGDVAPYAAVEAAWEPRPGAAEARPAAAVGKYLERPVLHHTVGTRVSRPMARELAGWGIPSVSVHDEPPPFTPALVPARSATQHDSDPFARHLGSGLEKATLEAVHRSRYSDPGGTSFAAAMLDPETFGRSGPTRGFDPGEDDDDDDA